MAAELFDSCHYCIGSMVVLGSVVVAIAYLAACSSSAPFTNRHLEGVFRSEGSGERDVYLVARQTSGSVNIRLLTPESESVSSLAQIDRDASLSYAYMNYPRASAPKTSHIHRGAAILRLSGMPVSALRGRYWTDRDTRGELEFERRVSTLADDYEIAQKLFSGSG